VPPHSTNSVFLIRTASLRKTGEDNARGEADEGQCANGNQRDLRRWIALHLHNRLNE